MEKETGIQISILEKEGNIKITNRKVKQKYEPQLKLTTQYSPITQSVDQAQAPRTMENRKNNRVTQELYKLGWRDESICSTGQVMSTLSFSDNPKITFIISAEGKCMRGDENTPSS